MFNTFEVAYNDVKRAELIINGRFSYRIFVIANVDIQSKIEFI